MTSMQFRTLAMFLQMYFSCKLSFKLKPFCFPGRGEVVDPEGDYFHHLFVEVCTLIFWLYLYSQLLDIL